MKLLPFMTALLLTACTTPEQAVMKALSFCETVARVTGNDLNEHPVYEMECTERGGGNILASEQGTIRSVALTAVTLGATVALTK